MCYVLILITIDEAHPELNFQTVVKKRVFFLAGDKRKNDSNWKLLQLMSDLIEKCLRFS